MRAAIAGNRLAVHKARFDEAIHQAGDVALGDIEPLGQVTLGDALVLGQRGEEVELRTERPMARSLFDMAEWPRWCIRKKRNQIRAGVTLRSFIVRHPWRGSWVFSSAYGVSGLFVVAGTMPERRGKPALSQDQPCNPSAPIIPSRQRSGPALRASSGRIKGAEHGLSFAGDW